MPGEKSCYVYMCDMFMGSAYLSTCQKSDWKYRVVYAGIGTFSDKTARKTSKAVRVLLINS